MIELEEIKNIIPHRGKMLLLSRIIDYDIKGELNAEYDINEQCIFYDPAIQGVPSFAGFEFIAQGISAFSGIINRKKGDTPKIGFVLKVSSMKFYQNCIKKDMPVQIYIKLIDCTDSIYHYSGQVSQQGTKALEGNIMVMELNKDDPRFESLYKELME